jgi:hypothetical protein
MPNLYELQTEMAYRQDRMRHSIRRHPRRRFRHTPSDQGRPSGDARA